MEIINWWPGGRRPSVQRQVLLGLLFSVLVLLLAVAGELPAQEVGRLLFFVDTATFKALDDPSKSYVEIYILLSSKSLQFETVAGETWAHLQFQATIVDSLGVSHMDRQWRKDISLSPQEDLLKGYSLFEVVGVLLQPNFYDIHITLSDEISGSTGSVSGELYVPKFAPDIFSVSQLELSLDIAASAEAGDFVKNGVRVLPNPTRTYSSTVPVLYYYAEIYELLLGPDVDSTYTVRQEIRSTSDVLLKSYPPKTKRKPGRTSVEASGVNVVGLQPDTYFLRVQVRDNATGSEVFNQRWFRVTSPGSEDGSADSVLPVLTAEQAQYYQDLIRYLATSEDLNVYRSLNLEGKARFLEEFWRRRDPDPSTPENELRWEHMRRWNYVNQQFSRFQQQDGWKTDRGRVYIIYGQPDDIERYPSDITRVAWERWHYYSLEGGSEFIFADLSGFDNYLLIHSTAKGEYRDPRWPDKLSRNSMEP